MIPKIKIVGIKIIVLSMFLVSCNSFNSETYYKSDSIVYNNKIDPPRPEIVVKAVQCPVYKLPILGNIPPLPIREVQKTLSPEQLEIIQLKHISDLRAYIFTMKRDLAKNYSEYLKSCENNQ